MSASPRNIIASRTRGNLLLSVRRYVRLDTAFRSRQTELAYLEGQPGDVIEFAHAETGMQIGTIKVQVRRLITNWVWDN